MKYIFLSREFFTDYDVTKCPEIIQKQDRPYVMLLIKIDGLTYAVPFRSNINHSYAFITDPLNNCGIDFSKAIVISKSIYIDGTRKPYIRNNEHRALAGKKYKILSDLRLYINDYKKAVSSNAKRRYSKYKYSSLQYFHKELGLLI